MTSSAFEGKVAIVTGGSRGIGFAIADALASRGAAVTICGRDADRLRQAASELANRPGEVVGHQADVAEYSQVRELVSATTKQFGGLDILINNAGVGRFAAVSDLSPEDWRAVMGTNLDGVFHCCHAALPELRQRGGGWIINISSLSGTNPFVRGAAYCASKAGLNAFTEALMQEVRHHDIRVAYIMPGSVSTDFGSFGAADWKLSPADVARVAVDLISHPQRSLPSRVEIRPSRPPQR